MVIEEAAGVLKFRRRRERAERRLESSEQSLLRLQDLQREVRRQLRPLERQAEAARRHDGLVTELRALRLYLAGREIDSLGRRLERAELSHVELTEREAGQRSELARLDDLVATTETAVSEAQAWDGSDRLGRAERLLERQHGLANVVVERRRTVAGLLAAATEADVVASLEAEASRLASELAAALAAAEALVPERTPSRRSRRSSGGTRPCSPARPCRPGWRAPGMPASSTRRRATVFQRRGRPWHASPSASRDADRMPRGARGPARRPGGGRGRVRGQPRAAPRQPRAACGGRTSRRGARGGERDPAAGRRGSLARSRGQGGGASGRPRRGAGARRGRAAGRAGRRARDARRCRRDRRRLREGLARPAVEDPLEHGRGGRDGRRPGRVAPPPRPACTVASYATGGSSGSSRAAPGAAARRRPGSLRRRVRSSVGAVDAVLDELPGRRAPVPGRARGGAPPRRGPARLHDRDDGRRSPARFGLAHRAARSAATRPPSRRYDARRRRPLSDSPAPRQPRAEEDRRALAGARSASAKLRDGSTTPAPPGPGASSPGASAQRLVGLARG